MSAVHTARRQGGSCRPSAQLVAGQAGCRRRTRHGRLLLPSQPAQVLMPAPPALDVLSSPASMQVQAQLTVRCWPPCARAAARTRCRCWCPPTAAAAPWWPWRRRAALLPRPPPLRPAGWHPGVAIVASAPPAPPAPGMCRPAGQGSERLSSPPPTSCSSSCAVSFLLSASSSAALASSICFLRSCSRDACWHQRECSKGKQAPARVGINLTLSHSTAAPPCHGCAHPRGHRQTGQPACPGGTTPCSSSACCPAPPGRPRRRWAPGWRQRLRPPVSPHPVPSAPAGSHPAHSSMSEPATPWMLF
jgi:hypothetical protein